jgi:hypothetical protein
VPTPWHLSGSPSAIYTVTAAAPGYRTASQSFRRFSDSDHIGLDLNVPRSENFSLERAYLGALIRMRRHQ